MLVALIIGLMFFALCVIGAVIGLVKDFDEDHTVGTFILAAFAAVFSIGMTVGAIKENKEYQYVEYNIVSIRQESAYKGKFFLGCGHVDEDLYYYCYAEVKEDTYKLVSFDVDEVYIVESDTQPRVEILKKKGDLHEERYIYVPFNTITIEFKL